MEDEAWKKLSSDFPWTERMLEKYRNKVDWEEVSNNYNMLWTPSMLDKFKWKINWHQLSSRSSEALMITENIERFKDYWDWKELSGNGPAQYAHFEGFTGKIGFISALSHKFCSDCNRIRLTAEGFLKPCLQYAGGEDLRKLLRSGCTDEELRRVMERAIYGKPACHHFEEREPAGAETAEMFRIGG